MPCAPATMLASGHAAGRLDRSGDLHCRPAPAGQTVSLGDSSPVPYHFDAPVLVPELASPSRTDNPTLTGDLLEIYFTTDRVSGNGDVWFATRATATAPFGTPAPVTVVNGDSFETSSAISTDGLTLVVRLGSRWRRGRQRHLGRRAGDARLGLVDAAERRGAELSGRRHPAPARSARAGDADGVHEGDGDRPGLRRQLPDLPGGTPHHRCAVRRAGGDPRARLRRPQHGRRVPDRRRADDVLLVGAAGGAGRRGGVGVDAGSGRRQDRRRRRRQLGSVRRLAAVDERVRSRLPQPLGDLNTAADERDPWLSPDGKTLYFTSDRGGVLSIYTAAVKPR